jgi:hypothetical protein
MKTKILGVVAVGVLALTASTAKAVTRTYDYSGNDLTATTICDSVCQPTQGTLPAISGN